MRLLVTGHTGFKGSWMTLLARELGHEVVGLSLDPEAGSLFLGACMDADLRQDLRCDIRNLEATHDVISALEPEACFHFAAQPLVRASYADPRGTFETNVMGTFAVVDAIQRTPSVRAAVIITTDKVYRNVGRGAGYREDEPLGGHDPYSASKAAADIVTQSMRASFPGPPLAIARAGNVIGGGDIGADRLMPDLMASFTRGEPALIRNPSAVRPWQHVLDCLWGYVLLLEALVEGRISGGEWNLGPDDRSHATVGDVATMAASMWGPGASWTTDQADHPHEAAVLALDASKARLELGWVDHLSLEEAVLWTVEWTRAIVGGDDPRTVTLRQIDAYLRLAGRA